MSFEAEGCGYRFCRNKRKEVSGKLRVLFVGQRKDDFAPHGKRSTIPD